MSTEVWQRVVGWEHAYEASDLGRVRSLDRVISVHHTTCAPYSYPFRGRVLRPGHGNGYPMVVLVDPADPSRKVTRSVHSMVLEAFVGPRPEGMQVCHGNGNRRDARLENLRYDTAAANHQDSVLHGTVRVGEKHPTSKLKNVEVLAIKSGLREGIPISILARQYGVNYITIHDIKSGRTWRHLKETA